MNLQAAFFPQMSLPRLPVSRPYRANNTDRPEDPVCGQENTAQGAEMCIVTAYERVTCMRVCMLSAGGGGGGEYVH